MDAERRACCCSPTPPGSSTRSRLMTRSPSSGSRATEPMASPSTPRAAARRGGIAASGDTNRERRHADADRRAVRGRRLNQPNDIAVRSDGTIYFTDPLYADYATELDFHGVFRIAPDGTLTAERRGAITEPPTASRSRQTRPGCTSPTGRTIWSGSLTWPPTAPFPRPANSWTRAKDPTASRSTKPATCSSPLRTASRSSRPMARPGRHPGAADTSQRGLRGADGRTLYITAESGLYRVTLVNPGPY